MIPHQKKMVERLERSPFAMIGINSDPDRSVLLKRLDKDGITWRQALEESPFGGIPSRWNVRLWPSIYVLDAEGVIRYRNVHGGALDDAVDRLLAKIPRSNGDGQ